MANATLLSYLRNVLRLETDKYVCEQIWAKHNGMIQQCQLDQQAISSKIVKPIEPKKQKIERRNSTPPLPNRRVFYDYWSLYEECAFFVRLALAIISHILVLLIIYICSITIGMPDNASVGRALLELLLRLFLLIMMFALPIITFVQPNLILMIVINPIRFLINLAYRITIYPTKYKHWKKECDIIRQEDESRYQSECAAAEQKYEQDMVDYKKAMDEYHRQCNKLIEAEHQREATLVASQNAYCEKYWAIDSTLQELYNTDIIHPDYRSIIPVSMFVNYIEKDRCPGLGGVNGAYNMYEEELRAERIINRLDKINEQIEFSMGCLYHAILEGNAQIERLTNETRRTRNALADGFERQQEMQKWSARLIADQTAALASIEEEKLFEIRRIGNALNS